MPIALSMFWIRWNGSRSHWNDGIHTGFDAVARSMILHTLIGPNQQVMCHALLAVPVALFSPLLINAQFGTETIIYSGQLVLADFRIADMDGDLDMDIVFSTTPGLNPDLVWIENTDGEGMFGATHPIQTGFGGPPKFDLADINGDGSLDVVFVGSNNETIYHSANDGNGVFGPPIGVYAGSTSVWDMVCSDITGSSLPEIVFTRAGGTFWYVNVSGTFQAMDSLGNLGGPVLHARDMNMDGYNDILTIYWTGQVEIGVNSTGGGASWPIDTVSNLPNWSNQTIVIDVEPDGDLDLLQLAGHASWLENFAADGQPWPSFEHHAIGSEQVNQSGWSSSLGCGNGTDVVWSPMDSLPVQWLNYDGALNDFSSPLPLPAIPSGQGMRTGDIDGDGDEDLVVVHGDTLSWFANNLSPFSTGIASASLHDILCANGGPYPLPDGSPSGGTWSGYGVDANVFSRDTVGDGEYPLVYTVLDTSGCPVSAVDTVEVITGTSVEPPLSGTIYCIYNDIQFTGYPAGGMWSGVVDSTGFLDSDCALRPLIGPSYYTYTDTTGAQCYGGGAFFQLQYCATPAVYNTGPFCLNDGVQIIEANGPALGGVWLDPMPFDSVVFDTVPGVTMLWGYFDPAQGAGTYQVVAGANGGGYCADTSITYIVVNPLPDAQIFSTGPYCVQEDTAFIHAWPPGQFAGAAMGNDSLGLVLPSALDTGWHQFTFAVTDTNGCTTLLVDSFRVEVCTGMVEENGSNLTIAPNPTEDEVEIRSGDGPADMLLMDAQGRVVWKRERLTSPARIDLSHLAPGPYQLRVLNQRGIAASGRLIVH